MPHVRRILSTAFVQRAVVIAFARVLHGFRMAQEEQAAHLRSQAIW